MDRKVVVGGLPHIAIEPYVTCNFACSYCVNNRYGKNTIKIWEAQKEDTIKFLNTLSRKMILTSGGEPMLWQGWEQVISETNHLWYFLSNGSLVPQFLNRASIRNCVKLFIIAYHHEFISVDKLIENILRLQDMGYPVFVKVLYLKNKAQFNEWDKINNASIPVSFVPLVGVTYSEAELKMVMDYCISDVYRERFLHTSKRQPKLCVAGTSESFELDGAKLLRCSHYDIPMVADIRLPKCMKKLWRGATRELLIKSSHVLFNRSNPLIGTMYAPKFYSSPQLCKRESCTCEWHIFSGMTDGNENWKWQHLLETGKWISSPAKTVELSLDSH